jgi:hypothetical protein
MACERRVAVSGWRSRGENHAFEIEPSYRKLMSASSTRSKDHLATLNAGSEKYLGRAYKILLQNLLNLKGDGLDLWSSARQVNKSARLVSSFQKT